MKVVKIQPTTLAAPLGATDTSFTLQAFLDSKGNQLTLSNFGTFVVIVLKQGTVTEMIKCSAFSYNSDGSCVFTVASSGRDLDATSPYAGHSSGQIFQAGATAIVTNDPYSMSTFANVQEANTFTGTVEFQATVTFDVPPVSATNPTSSTQVANKAYVDGVAQAGGANASSTTKGITKLSVDPVSSTNPIAVGDNDSRVPTTSQVAAMAGTSGTTPSGSNKFVDNADTSATSAANKVIRANGSGKLDTGFLASLTTYNYQEFTSSGTWTKPSNLTGNELVIVQAWGGGGGGGGYGNTGPVAGGGGGGGAFTEGHFKASELNSTETVTIGSGGTGGTANANGGVGGDTTFGSHLTAYGGGGGGGGSNTYNKGGGGGGVLGDGVTIGAGGSPLGGANSAGDSGFGGGGGAGSAGGTAGGNSAWGGGGGGSANNNSGGAGGKSLYGGGGGAGGGGAGATAGGTSIFGGAGGTGGSGSTAPTAGSQPGGGGGGSGTSGGATSGANGGAGKVRVWTVFNPQ